MKLSEIQANVDKNSTWERCKGVYCIDLGESFHTSIYLQKSTWIQPRTSPLKFRLLDAVRLVETGERERESSRERERAREGERARCWTAISVGEVREGLGEDSLPDFVSSWT